MAARRRTPHEIQEEMRRAADAARKAAEESNRASDDAISRCPVFCADEAFAAQGLECPISTEAIVVGDKVLKMPCGHMFLEENIKRWLANANSCPICRAELPSASGGERLDPEREAFMAARRVADDAARQEQVAAAASHASSGGFRRAAGPATAGGMLAHTPHHASSPRSAHAGYPMAGAAADSGAWRSGPRYKRDTGGDGCAVI